MDLSQLPLFGVLKEKLGYLSARQSVLAQNIANADTPDYKARDILEPDFSKVAARYGYGGQTAQGLQLPALRMAVTQSGHMGMATGMTSGFNAEKDKSTYELSPTGNTVVNEEEIAKMAENSMEYQKALNLYAKTVALFKIAIGRPSGA